jgi:hypothetical protein
MAVETEEEAIERSIRRFHEMERNLKEAQARLAEVEKEAADRIRAVEREAGERVGRAEREEARLRGHVEVLTAQKARDDAEVLRLTRLLSHMNVGISTIAGTFIASMEKLREGGLRAETEDRASEAGQRGVESAVAQATARAEPAIDFPDVVPATRPSADDADPVAELDALAGAPQGRPEQGDDAPPSSLADRLRETTRRLRASTAVVVPGPGGAATNGRGGHGGASGGNGAPPGYADGGGGIGRGGGMTIGGVRR